MVPQIELELALGSGAALKCRVGSISLGEFGRSEACSVVDGLKNHLVDFDGLRGFEWSPHFNEGIGHSLHTNSNGSMAEVAIPCLGDGVVVDIDDFVEVCGDYLGDFHQSIVIEDSVINELLEVDRSEIANSYFIWVGVLDDFGAEI